jgi:hypothetical protein
MTLQDALAIYLYVWMTDESLDGRDERVVEAAVEIIEREGRKALAAHSRSNQPQSPNEPRTNAADASRRARRTAQRCCPS